MVGDIASLTTMALAAFSAATLLPGGSEFMLLGLIAAGTTSTTALVVVATLANTAGGFTNWWIGRLLAAGADTERGAAWLARFRLTPERIATTERIFTRWGWAALLVCWLPVIGDPITLVSGMLRYSWWRFLLITAIGRAVRYGVVAGGGIGLLQWLGWMS